MRPVFTQGSRVPATPTGATIARSAPGFAAALISILERYAAVVGPGGLEHHCSVRVSKEKGRGGGLGAGTGAPGPSTRGLISTQPCTFEVDPQESCASSGWT